MPHTHTTLTQTDRHTYSASVANHLPSYPPTCPITDRRPNSKAHGRQNKGRQAGRRDRQACGQAGGWAGWPPHTDKPHPHTTHTHRRTQTRTDAPTRAACALHHSSLHTPRRSGRKTCRGAWEGAGPTTRWPSEGPRAALAWTARHLTTTSANSTNLLSRTLRHSHLRAHLHSQPITRSRIHPHIHPPHPHLRPHTHPRLPLHHRLQSRGFGGLVVLMSGNSALSTSHGIDLAV